MPTDAALLAQLQSLWQAVPPIVERLRTPTAEGPPSGECTSGGFEPFDWFDMIDDADREYLLGRHCYPEACGFCGGRYVHNAQCVALCDEWAVKMPFGKHKGQRVADVPPDYLRWLLASGKELNGELQRDIERILKIGQAD